MKHHGHLLNPAQPRRRQARDPHLDPALLIGFDLFLVLMALTFFWAVVTMKH